MAHDNQSSFLDVFEDPEKARNYSQGPIKFTPGFTDLHKMVNVLLAEKSPTQANILVHGAGGGLELEAMASTQLNWQFVGVDPAKAMLDEAEARLGSLMSRITLHHGFIDSAPSGPFDAATSLLTLHFLEADERIDTIRKIVSRLKPGAPFVVVHSSFPQTLPERDVWLSRYQAYAVASGVPEDMATTAWEGVASMNTLLDADHDLKIMHEAGLSDVSLFYAAFTWRGWVGYAP